MGGLSGWVLLSAGSRNRAPWRRAGLGGGDCQEVRPSVRDRDGVVRAVASYRVDFVPLPVASSLALDRTGRKACPPPRGGCAAE